MSAGGASGGVSTRLGWVWTGFRVMLIELRVGLWLVSGGFGVGVGWVKIKKEWGQAWFGFGLV